MDTASSSDPNTKQGSQVESKISLVECRQENLGGDIQPDSNTKQESQVETIISPKAVTDTSSDSEENLGGNIQPDPNTKQDSQVEGEISLVEFRQENLGGDIQLDPNTKQESQVETIIFPKAVMDTSSDSEENLGGNIQPDPNTKQESQVETIIFPKAVMDTSSDSEENLGGNIQPDPNTEQDTQVEIEAVTDTSSDSQENLGGNIQPDSNTEQGSQVEIEAVADTSSDSQKSLGGDIQPEDNLQQKNEYWRYTPLVKAALEGNWESAENFFNLHRDALSVPITKSLDTALHIAVGTGKAQNFVKKLVESMPVESLELCDDEGFTALHTAASVGNTAAAEVLVQKHPALLHISGSRFRLPIHVAAANGRKDTLRYLLDVTTNTPESMLDQGESGTWLLVYIMTSKFYDVALDLIQQYPKLAKSVLASSELAPSVPGGNTLLVNLALEASAFLSGSRLNFWQRKIYSCVPGKVESCPKSHRGGDIEDQNNTSPNNFWANFCISACKGSQKLHFILWKVFEFAAPQIKGIQEEKQKHNQALQLTKYLCKEIQYLNDSDAYESHAKAPLFLAASLGVHEVVEEIVDSFPSLVWARDSDYFSIFHHAIVERHENVFNLLYQMSERKRVKTIFRDKNGNTTLHMAGRLAPQNKLNLVPGAALQMQRELQWFEEVKKFVIPMDMHWRNDKNETPEMVFTNAHKELIKEGEEWIKYTANSCTIVAALIVTIAFAAEISVPGGHNDANGLPILSNETAFLVFAISNAFSLFTSTTSLMMFLSILTSTHAEKDFLFALPRRLIIGLVTLFWSITAMMAAFSSIVYLLFGYKKRWVLIPTVVFSGIPIISFVCLEFPLLLDLITSTYGSGIFGKKSNRLFY